MDNAVGDCGDFFVVGGDEKGGVVFFVDFFEELDDFGAGFFVEVAGGFVGEDDFGVVDEGAGDGDALFLAAGEGFCFVVFFVGEFDFGEEFVDVVDFFAVKVGGEEDVVEDGEVWFEVEFLEDEANFFAVEGDRAFGGFVEAADELEEGGFSGAGRSDDGDEFTGFDFDCSLF